MRDKKGFIFSLEVAANTDYSMQIFVEKGQWVVKDSLAKSIQGLRCCVMTNRYKLEAKHLRQCLTTHTLLLVFGDGEPGGGFFISWTFR